MKSTSTIACFGAAHWDCIGQSADGHAGPDKPGTIRVRPGGVAANVALALAGQGLVVELLSILGKDREGDDLLATLRAAGVGTAFCLQSQATSTGRYVAIEDHAGELIAAVADCRAVEALAPGDVDPGPVMTARFWFLETNLPVPVIEVLAAVPGRPPLVVNPVSPARATRLSTVLGAVEILYCNRTEAEALLQTPFATAAEAARALLASGPRRAVVTDGPGSVCDASSEGLVSADPDPAGFTSATGAGDAFLARHLAAVIDGEGPALHRAIA